MTMEFLFGDTSDLYLRKELDMAQLAQDKVENQYLFSSCQLLLIITKQMSFQHENTSTRDVSQKSVAAIEGFPRRPRNY